VSDVVLFGTGDFAQIACEYLDRDSSHEVIAFTVHERYIVEPELLSRPVIPFEQLEDKHPPSQCAMFVAVGFSGANKTRRSMYEECKSKGYELISYVNSKAIHWGDLDVGDNCFIFEANVIQPFVRIGSNVILWSGNHIGHHTRIADHCFVASHVVISGGVTLGEETFVGVNATLRDGVTVAPRCVIGAGALIMKDTEEGDVYSVPGTQPRPQKSWELKGF
jgi:sugar O-acyltransferase (sialic acid O-acetyltransferase NeuD family)